MNLMRATYRGESRNSSSRNQIFCWEKKREDCWCVRKINLVNIRKKTNLDLSFKGLVCTQIAQTENCSFKCFSFSAKQVLTEICNRKLKQLLCSCIAAPIAGISYIPDISLEVVSQYINKICNQGTGINPAEAPGIELPRERRAGLCVWFPSQKKQRFWREIWPEVSVCSTGELQHLPQHEGSFTEAGAAEGKSPRGKLPRTQKGNLFSFLL